MENEVKQRNLQRNRRRERAQRMQAQRESKVKDGDSGEDESPAREKPPRPPARRKKSREPLAEEDIIDGFAIMAFRTYEDLEAAVKCASSPRTNALSTKPRLPLAALASDTGRNHPTNNVNSHGITLLQDAGTSDDSGRASERLTGSSVAPRDPDSSRDRLSDCDSEGDDDKASPDNSRNASPRYHDVSMEDASDAGSLFRVTSATAGGGAGGKNELVARGGSGGALALSRAPVGGSASPAPAPLPQPAPSPAPAALPPPALPPPHRPNGAHIPAMDGHGAAAAAATQIPAKPVGAASGPSKLQPGARPAADSPTPAPPAPLFPSHAAYQSQSHAAAGAGTGAALPLPDYRHTNHETRTAPSAPSPAPPPPQSALPPPAPAPLDLHAHRADSDVEMRSPTAPQPLHPASVPTSVPTSFPSRATGVSPVTAPRSTPPAVPTCLPSQTLSGRPVSPAAPVSRPYPPPAIGSSHVNSSTSSSIHGQTMAPFHSQASLQKHSVQSVYTSRPSHLAPFGMPLGHTHAHATTASQQAATHTSHSINSHSIASHATSHHASHPMSHLAAMPAPSHLSPLPLPPLPLPLPPTASSAATTLSSYTPTMKHPGLGIPPSPGHHPAPLAPPLSLHHTTAHVDLTTSCSNASTVVTSSANSNIGHPPLAPPVIDSRQPTPAELPARTESQAIVSSGLATNGFPPPAVYSGTAYPPLYAPYATTLQHSPYLPPAAASPRNSADTRTSLSVSPLVAPKTPKGVRPHTPGSTGAAGSALASYSPGPSPTRERESFSNISSLSRSTPASSAATSSAPLTPSLIAPLAAPLPASVSAPIPGQLSGPLGSSLVAPLGPPLTTPLAAPTPTPASAAPTHLSHSLAPVPTVPSISSSAKPPAHWGVTRASPAEGPRGFAPAPPLFGAPLAPPPNPNPFSAESLFNTSPGADLLRRELDNRFLAVAGAAGAGGGVRTEMHHHQHQHTHVHQHPPPAPPPPQPAPPQPAPPPQHHHPPHHPHHPHHLLVPHPPMFKDVSKMPSLYRSSMGLGYPYSSSLLHPPSPYVPPTPLSYAPAKKTGKWNAMHVRIAWEIYNHQHKDKAGGASVAPGADKEKLRAFSTAPPPHPAPPPPPPAAALAPPPAAYRSPYELPPHYLAHHPHLARYEPGPFAPHPDRALRVAGVSPFARYPPAAYAPPPPSFQLSAYGRDLALSSSLHAVHHALPPLHDPWRTAPRPSPAAPPPQPSQHAAVAAAAADAARRDHEERERERARRDRDERERRDRDERERRKAREQRDLRDRDLERARARSPLRNGALEPKEERKELSRGPPALSAYAPPPPPPAPWDPYRGFDPLQHMRFAPLVEAAIRAEEDRAKMLSAYAHHQQMKAGPLVRGAGGPLPPLGGHPHPHPHSHPHPLALPPMQPLDLLKKEEPR